MKILTLLMCYNLMICSEAKETSHLGWSSSSKGFNDQKRTGKGYIKTVGHINKVVQPQSKLGSKEALDVDNGEESKIYRKSYVIIPRSFKNRDIKSNPLKYHNNTGNQFESNSVRKRDYNVFEKIKKGFGKIMNVSVGDIDDHHHSKLTVKDKEKPFIESGRADRFRKTEILNITKKADISDVNSPGLEPRKQSFPRNLDSSFGPKIGKAYGDTDSYQPLGDGVYLLNDASKTKSKQLKDNLPDTQRSLNEILSNLEEEDSSILDASKNGDVHIPLSVSNSNEEPPEVQRGRDLTVSIASRQNVEDVTPNEVNMINDIENSLRVDDKKANQESSEYAGSDSSTRVLNEGEEKPKGFDDLANAADKLDKEFVEQDPYVVKTSVSEKSVFPNKKDRTVTKRTSDTDFLIARINDADEKLQDFAGSSDFNMDDYDENRAKDIAELAVQEDKEIMVEGPNKAMESTKNLKVIPKKEPKKVAIESSSDAVSPIDTGFFMDGNDDTNITFYDNATISNTIKEKTIQVKADNESSLLEKDNTEKSKKGSVKTSNVEVNERNHRQHSKSKTHKQSNKKTIKLNADKQDLGLINALNVSDPQFGRHHSGSAMMVNGNDTAAKHIHLPGEHGVQIDLFITREKGASSKKKENVRKANTPSRDSVEGGTKKFVTTQNGNVYQPEENGEEIVNLSGALSDQEKQMFGVPNTMQEYNAKTPVNSPNDIQQEHPEGNSPKDYNDISIQDGINSDELKDAIKESDLKGLKQIRTELDAQDLKTAMEYFGKAERAERLHLHSGGHVETVLNAGGINNNKIMEDSIARDGAIYKDEKSHEKINAIMRLLEFLSKRKTNKLPSSKDSLDEGVTNYNTSLEETARKIEDFINLDKGSKTLGYSAAKVSQEPIELVANDENVFGSAESSNSKNNEGPQLNALKTGAELKNQNVPSQIISNSRQLTLEVIKNLFKNKNSGNEQVLALQKLLAGPDEGEPLQINGGKILGGNVRGGRILGGVVTGGNITGGEVDGGRITGGTIVNGLFINGLMEDGVLEGGKIRGGKIEGGVIKAGVVDGGVIKGGVMLGGHLINGTIEGGVFKGGDIYDGTLASGEMDGGALKGGKINGGTMKGGVIESGSLDGGVMLAGVLRGGIVKSGVIKGGIVDKGVVVQDGEIGPGVEIHEGIIKGGRITANEIKRTSPHDLNNHVGHSDENRSNIMYSIEVTPTKDGVNTINESEENAITFDKDDSLLEESMDTLSDKKEKTENNSHKKSLDIAEMLNTFDSEESKRASKLTTIGKMKNTYSTNRSLQEFVDREAESAAKQDPNLKRLLSMMESPVENMRKTTTTTPSPKVPSLTPVLPTMYPAYLSNNVIAFWDLSKAKFNIIPGNPGPELRMFNGVMVRNGHAVLDGQHGYLDAGDFQGKCFSDPEVCEHGFTIQMTLKLYSDSVLNDKKQFIIDSGATLNDSRGISLWVSKGKLNGMVSTRESSWCIQKTLFPYIERWISLTLTWRKDKGMQLYINCDLFEQSDPDKVNECEKCFWCHKTDVSTRLMFGRPNKGPHFKVIHMAVGQISLYEKFATKYEVDEICGGKTDNPTPPQNFAEVPSNVSPKKTSYQSPAIRYTSITYQKREPYPLYHDSVHWPTPVSRSMTVSHKIIQMKPKAVKWPKPSVGPLREHKVRKYPTSKLKITFADKRRLIQPKRWNPRGNSDGIRLRTAQESKPRLKDLQLADSELPLIHFIEGNHKKFVNYYGLEDRKSEKSVIASHVKPYSKKASASKTLVKAFMSLKH